MATAKKWIPFKETYTSEEDSGSNISDKEPSDSSVVSSEHYESVEEEPPIVLKRGSGRPLLLPLIIVY